MGSAMHYEIFSPFWLHFAFNALIQARQCRIIINISRPWPARMRTGFFIGSSHAAVLAGRAAFV